MENSRYVLLKLVRMAMGWEYDFALPPDVDWSEVVRMSQEQGVTAILIDGYGVYCKENPGAQNFLSLPEYNDLKFQVLGQVQMTENNYYRHLAALTELSDILSKKEIPFMIMKGFACGQYYPNPKHRPCGDIDIYPGEEFTESNETLNAAGINVDPYYYRHSASMIKGVMIENHKLLCDLRGPRHQTQLLEKQLEDEGEKSIVEGKNVSIDNVLIKGAKYPTANFNALFLPWHVSAHCMFERVTIRHLLDWALFLVHEGKEIDIETIREAKRHYTYGYCMFVDILTAMSVNYLKIPIRGIPSGFIEDAQKCSKALVEKVFDYMFVGQPRERDANVWKFRWNNVKRVWKERWKYKELYGMSTGAFLFHKAKGVLLKEGEE